MSDSVNVVTPDAARLRSDWAGSWLHHLGLREGSRVAITAPSAGSHPSEAARVQASVALVAYGALRAGVVPVMINPVLTADEQAVYIADAAVEMTLSEDRVEQMTQTPPPSNVQLSDVPLGRPMHFTSGTTGRSKGVWSGVLDEAAAAAYWSDEHDQWPIEADDVVLNHGPLAHSAPLRFSMLAFMHGATMVYTGPFDVDRTSAAISSMHPSVAMAVPTHLQRLLQQAGGPPPSHYRMLVHAGSACPPDLKREIHQWAGAERVWEFLGSTEGQFTACRGTEWQERPGTLGRARHGRTLHIDDGSRLDPGVIWCSAPDFADFSYFGDPAKSAAAWSTFDGARAFTVGDLGRLDDDGYLYLHGRRTDLIVTGGVNVYPAEVEAELRKCPGVVDVAVYGREDDEWGQRVCAAVVGTIDTRAILAWCQRHVAGYRRPKQITMVDELPLTTTGKVKRDGLAQWVAAHGR